MLVDFGAPWRSPWMTFGPLFRLKSYECAVHQRAWTLLCKFRCFFIPLRALGTPLGGPGVPKPQKVMTPIEDYVFRP